MLLGYSAQHRPIIAIEIGDPDSPADVLIVGCMDGNEPAGIAIAGTLADRLTIYYHQPRTVVDDSEGPRAIERRYAQLTSLPRRPLTDYPGSAVGWQDACSDPPPSSSNSRPGRCHRQASGAIALPSTLCCPGTSRPPAHPSHRVGEMQTRSARTTPARHTHIETLRSPGALTG
jgi:hypothetical protein